MIYLLDISVLLAWLWDSHEHHHRVLAWESGQQLAVCPLTELGFLRISSSSTFGATIEQAREMLKDWQDRRQPEFVPCDLRALQGMAPPNSAKTTDFYFAELAHFHSMQWATLDERSGHPAAFVIPHPPGQSSPNPMPE